MTDNDLQTSRVLKTRLLQKYNLLDFRVFGSRARGDNSADSDLDVFIEVEEFDSVMRRDIQDIAWEVGFDYSVLVAPVVYSRLEAEASRAAHAPFFEAVGNEGVVI
ncbi:MAG: nucleotidyltransferase domain-containing protein [Chitinivibrionales bacterium]|nr:nucleotidyltransferase domain-containing protein [Chitinivibrionales bacterium]